VSGPREGKGATESLHWEYFFAFDVSKGGIRDGDVRSGNCGGSETEKLTVMGPALALGCRD